METATTSDDAEDLDIERITQEVRQAAGDNIYKRYLCAKAYIPRLNYLFTRRDKSKEWIPASSQIWNIVNAGSRDEHKTRKVIAFIVGCSDVAIQRCRAIDMRADDSFIADVRDGKLSIAQAYKMCIKNYHPNTISQIEKLAATGMNASQIADEIGIGKRRVQKLAYRHGINIHQSIIGNRRDPKINKILEEVAISAQSFVVGFSLIDNDLTGIEDAKIPAWISELKMAHTSIGNLINKLQRYRRKYGI